jgi:hypothetical protein
MHETLPHGQQILDAVLGEELKERHSEDLLDGAKKGAVMYLRMAEWALQPDGLAASVDAGSSHVLYTTELSTAETVGA